jgi:hypothetical protein
LLIYEKNLNSLPFGYHGAAGERRAVEAVRALHDHQWIGDALRAEL